MINWQGHTGIVHHILKRLYSTRLEYRDLEQTGMEALVEASRNFDESRGNSFYSYAYPYIRGKILNDIKRASSIVRDCHHIQNRDVLIDADEGVDIGSSSFVARVTEDLFWWSIRKRTRKELHRLLTAENERHIVARYGLGGDPPLSFREYRKKYQIPLSYQRVQQIEQELMEILRGSQILWELWKEVNAFRSKPLQSIARG